MKGFVIGAEKSGSGKTTITTGIIRAMTTKGLKVAPFKCGPDYIDTLHLAKSAKHTADNLDTVMLDERAVRQVFADGCEGRDLAVAEGVMGFFDGVNHTDFKGSTYDIAVKLGLPAVIVLNAASQSYTSAAIMKGIQSLCKGVPLAGVIVNNIASANHERLIADAVKYHTGLPVLGCVPKQEEPLVRSRHLGINTALETDEEYYEKCAELAEKYIDLKTLSNLQLTRPLEAKSKAFPEPDKVCAVAYDKAFSFYYEANLRELKQRGYQIRLFSPLNGEIVKDADLIYLGGGYPELYAEELSKNSKMLKHLADYSKKGGHIIAECGGMMLLTKGVHIDKGFFPFAGVFDAECRMTDQRQSLGYVKVTDNLHLNGLVGHEFHYSKLEKVKESYFLNTEKLTTKAKNEDCFFVNKTFGGYTHFHFLARPHILDMLLK